ncbi:hypothetical protein ACTHPZ_13775 [Bacillus halotolerans]
MRTKRVILLAVIIGTIIGCFLGIFVVVRIQKKQA